jgi:hypothetical protein
MKKICRHAGVFCVIIGLLVGFLAGLFSGFANLGNAALASSDAGWRGLPVKCYLDSAQTIRYCELEAANHSKAFLLVVPLQNSKFELTPAVNNPNNRTSAAVQRESAVAGVNGAYFNLKGGLSASYVTINGRQICNPRENSLLAANPKLKPYLVAIFNRSELRILADKKGKISARIQLHDEPLPPGCTLKHALQAGPRLLPELTAREEAFLRTEPDGSLTDSIGVLKTAARTAFGITADDHCLLLSVSGPKQDEFSSGITLAEVAELLKNLGCVEAINFDGGTSTTMVVKLDPGEGCTMVCGREPETLVKSCLLLKKLP